MDFLRAFWNEAVAVGAEDLLHVALRSLIVVVFVFIVFRYVGERGVAQLDIVSLLILIGLGSAVGDPMFYRDVSLTTALLAVLIVIGAFKFAIALSARVPAIGRWVTPEPIPLIVNGAVSAGGLKRADLSEHELLSLARLHGVESLAEIKTSYLEVNGQISVIPLGRGPATGRGDAGSS